MTDYDTSEEIDVEIFEGPSGDVPFQSLSDLQDDAVAARAFGFMSVGIRNFIQTIDWYRKHDNTSTIGFNPDGMCLKVCRVARGIPSRYLTAKISQDATPREYRVYNVEDLRAGMVLYYDDPNDSNRAGHIVTMIGRVPNANPKSLHDILVETNSVQSGRITTVRGDYFPTYWGDKFQFGATWLNGYEIDHFKVSPPKKKSRRPKWVRKAIGNINKQLETSPGKRQTGLLTKSKNLLKRIKKR